MSKHDHHEHHDDPRHHDHSPPPAPPPEYSEALHGLQIQLTKLQNHVIRTGMRVLVVFEGRDGAGKDGVIARIVEHLSPRETRVVALGMPSDRDQHTWYFQRFVPHLPADGEIVLFNRSWYNRAGVETVMGFCTKKERTDFMEAAPRFEHLLANSGMTLRKFYLDIDKAEQKRRLAERDSDPLKQWKRSPIDEVAVKHWEKYSKARDEMLAHTHTVFAPWSVVRADGKHVARIEIIKSILGSIDYEGKDDRLLVVDPKIVFSAGATETRELLIAP